MKKHKKIIFSIIIAFVIIGIIFLISMIDSDKTLLEKSTFTFEDGINVSRLNFEKKDNTYVVTFDITNDKKIKFNSNDYNVYFMDKNDNLLLKYDGVTLGDFDGNTSLRATYNIVFDISSLDRIVVIKKSEKLNYNKDLTDELKYLGENSQEIELIVR